MAISMRDWLAILFLLLLSIGLYSINLERPPHHDELYHVLAAEGLLATGEPAIGAEGRYWRGYPLTWLVAQSFDVFGASLTAARLPAVLFMAGLVGLLFLFLRRESGPLAAWLGAGLFMVSPFAIDLAQFVRFYSMQGIVFFAGAWLVYSAIGRQRAWSWQLAMLVPAFVLLGIAVYLQPTTLLGVVGLGAWSVGAVLVPWLAAPGMPMRRKAVVVAGLLATGLLLLGALAATGLLQPLWQDYRTTSLFNQPHADQFWYYHALYTLFYPTLWSLFGVLVVLALIARPKVTIFLLTVFVIGFLLNSFAARKSLRYIAYAQPFLFALWGIGLAYALQASRGLFAHLTDRLAAGLGLLSGALAVGLARALIIAALLFAFLANPAWLRSVTLLAGITVRPELPPVQWSAARVVLEPWVETVDAVVTTDELGMLYYYGRADYLLSASKFGELPANRRAPFAADVRSDVPVVAAADDLQLVFDCHDTGLFVALAQHWLDGARMRQEVADAAIVLHAIGEQLELPRESRLVAFVWQHDGAALDPAACAALPGRAAQPSVGAAGG